MIPAAIPALDPAGPALHDPDGHEVRFYAISAHTDLGYDGPLVIDDAEATSDAREAEWLAKQGDA